MILVSMLGVRPWKRKSYSSISSFHSHHRLDQVMNRPRFQREVKPKIPASLYDDPNEERNGEELLTELKQQAVDERKKRLKEEDDEEEDDEERSYESDEKSDQNGEFDDESVVVKSQISNPGML